MTELKNSKNMPEQKSTDWENDMGRWVVIQLYN